MPTPIRRLGLFVALLTLAPLSSFATPLKNGDATGWGEVADPDRDCKIEFEKAHAAIVPILQCADELRQKPAIEKAHGGAGGVQ